MITRTPGLRLDLGGSAKGLAADWAASRLRAAGRGAAFVADCGGDLHVGGEHDVGVRHPLTGEVAWRLNVRDGAVASSGLERRVWRTPGGFAHHLSGPRGARRVLLERGGLVVHDSGDAEPIGLRPQVRVARASCRRPRLAVAT